MLRQAGSKYPARSSVHRSERKRDVLSSSWMHEWKALNVTPPHLKRLAAAKRRASTSAQWKKLVQAVVRESCAMRMPNARAQWSTARGIIAHEAEAQVAEVAEADKNDDVKDRQYRAKEQNEAGFALRSEPRAEMQRAVAFATRTPRSGRADAE